MPTPADPATLTRILYVHNSADIYGGSRSLLRLLSRLDRTRVDPLVVIPESGPLVSKLESKGIPLVIEPRLGIVSRSALRPPRLFAWIFWFPVAVVRVTSLVVRRRIDIVHVNSGVVLAPGLACLLAGVPLVWHIREWFGEFARLWTPYRYYILACASRVVAVSNAMTRQFLGSAKVMAINDGLDASEFAIDEPAARRAFRDEHRLGDAIVIGIVGRIKFVRKGQEVLLRAAALLRGTVPDFRVLVVGSAHPDNLDHHTRLVALIDELGLEDIVCLTGELPDTRPAYAAMDCFVLASAQPEPFSAVVLEAMALGKPVIATATGGSTEQVEDGATGFLVPPGAPRALAEKLAILMRDPDARHRMGEAGRRRVYEQFSLSRVAREIQDVYTALLPRG